MIDILHHIAGSPAGPKSGLWIDVVDPAVGSTYARVAAGGPHDVALAVAAAAEAFPSWSRTPARERSRLLLEIASRIEADLDGFARAECIDTGKPIAAARSIDVPRAIANIRFFATAILHSRSELHATDDVALNYTLRGPRGVAGCISPWNLPLYLLTWKVAPALATGNTVVAKPSEITPVTASMLAEVAAAAGLPEGVLNVVHGRGAEAGAAIVAHPDVGTISFTGGTATGAAIAAVAAPRFKKLALELGGKNPTVVFADADLERTVFESVRAAFSNQGQICLCGSRVLVEAPLYDRFVDRFVSEVRSLRVGDPLDPSTRQGALVSGEHLEKVLSYLDLAREEGGSFLCGGSRPSNLPERCREGFFLEPTVISGLGPECRTNREEIFGPVATVLPFRDEAEAVSIANATPYGLAASIWTRDLDRAHRVAERIASGTVWINCWMLRDLRVPFGGTKSSGVGREGGEEAIRFFTEPKNVCVRLTPDGTESAER